MSKTTPVRKWHDRVEVYRNHSEVSKIVLDDAALDAWFARAEQGGNSATSK